ncbi:MAG TPA: alanine dehydrogenase [Bacteroidales bacterium]|jgi:alanine dehydrogenase|nr:alanine dehydrogenase [Bacteroidales bacterium]MDI9553578.1 alanine dehydrogenase [Bacteroidota bacterium]MZP66124.1 alanine dehydrogenase [Bacteroidales bacterium]NLK54877.1 alanine dehydrogenase [Bacteroidales bacterium]HNY52178.1 alanine dehydrogenase [Bacteroidales bacterium]
MNEKAKNGSHGFSNVSLLPQEEQLDTAIRHKKISIGIPNDKKNDEKRVALTPEAVYQLVESGNEVILQKGAGAGANYSDKDYSENGAMITESPARVFSADAVIKVAPFTNQEADYLKGNQIVMSFLNVLQLNEETLAKLIRKKVTAIALEKIKDSNGVMPVMESMSEISGVTSVLIASDYLSNHHGGKGVLLGGITGVTPTDVVIIGANTAGEYAARAALGLGSQVKIFDQSLHNLRRFQNLINQRLQTSVFHPQVLKKAIKSADVLIGAIELEDLRPWYYITEDMVKTMKKGSVIIDLSIDRGGCIETTECRALRDPVYEKHGVVHFSAWNLPSRVARTASIALSNIFNPLLKEIAEAGGITQLLKNDRGMRNGVYLFNGILTNETLGQKFGAISKDLDLLISAF